MRLHLFLCLGLASSCAADVPLEVGLATEGLFGLPDGNHRCGGPRQCIQLRVSDLNVNRGADLKNHTQAALAGGVFIWMRGTGDFWRPRSNDYKLVDSSTGDTATITDSRSAPNGWRERTISLGGFANFITYYPPAGDRYGFNYDLCSGAGDPGVSFGGAPPGSLDRMTVCWGG